MPEEPTLNNCSPPHLKTASLHKIIRGYTPPSSLQTWNREHMYLVAMLQPFETIALHQITPKRAGVVIAAVAGTCADESVCPYLDGG